MFVGSMHLFVVINMSGVLLFGLYRRMRDPVSKNKSSWLDSDNL
jgi:hypothetical protein